MNKISLQLSLTALIALSSCVKNEQGASPQSTVKSYQVQPADTKPSVAPGLTTVASVNVTAVVDRSAILNQDFFYEADLQYSSIYDKKYDLYTQSSASGLIPVRYRIAGDELQLVADNKNQFPSDVNHPELLISRFKILAQDATTLTVSGLDSANYLAAQAGPASDAAAGAPEVQAQDHWIRSFSYVVQGNYMLQQSSVLLSNGNVIEFMESVFPRANLAVSSNFRTLQMNPDDPVGASDGPVARYRFLGSDKIFNGEQKLSFAEHFDLADATTTFDWYVTANIPDEALGPVKLAIEGWNRYFKSFNGIARDVMQFKGRLPDGIYIGDPRYNVVNWDSRRVAGAAYESQSFDPATGKQGHSIIYMPAAWIQIGLDYWKTGQFSEPGAESTVPRSRLVKSDCYRDLNEAAAYLASGKLKVSSESELKKFGYELLKQTLFHEVGHSLGLAHNFKGSLAYKPGDSKTIFSTSIMDYNDFEVERQAFDSVDTAAGPLLEYDRQALSVLYNNNKDVLASDTVVPACNDNESDSEAGGIDPLCIRYDIEHDPTGSVARAQSRILQTTIAGDVTLSDALTQVPVTIFSTDALAAIKAQADFDAAVQKLAASLTGSITYFLGTGRASLGYATRTNLRSLYQFGDGVLPSDYDATQMRERVYAGVQAILALKKLPDGVQASLDKAAAKGLELLKTSPYVTGLSAADSAKAQTDKQKLLTDAVAAYLKDGSAGLPAIRSRVVTSLARHPAAPFFLGKVDKSVVDYEMMVVGLISDVLADTARSAAERTAAATSLATFKGRTAGDKALAKAVESIGSERDAATDNKSRELADTLLKALQADKSSD